MKHLVITILCIVCCLAGFAQQRTAKVILKNGTSITGIITEFDPSSHIVIRIAGFESRLKMSDVASIEDNSNDDKTHNDDILPATTDNAFNVDYEGLPDSYMLKVGPYQIEMTLVKGGTFSMGFDGRGSLDMDSEPVHLVTLNSFYINKEPLTEDVANYLLKGKERHSKKESYYHPFDRNSVVKIVDRLSHYSEQPVTIISEAQWEYSATNTQVFAPFVSQSERNYCLDYYADYIANTQPQLNPTGPQKGKYHVVRQLSNKANRVYYRYDNKPGTEQPIMTMFIRFVLPASAITK